MKTNYSQFLKMQADYQRIISALAKVGIKLKEFGFIEYEWQKIDYIMEAVNNESFGYVSMPFLDSLALSLACTEEDRNNHIEDDEIEMVAKFFDIRITRADVSRVHSKYI